MPKAKIHFNIKWLQRCASLHSNPPTGVRKAAELILHRVTSLDKLLHGFIHTLTEKLLIWEREVHGIDETCPTVIKFGSKPFDWDQEFLIGGNRRLNFEYFELKSGEWRALFPYFERIVIVEETKGKGRKRTISQQLEIGYEVFTEDDDADTYMQQIFDAINNYKTAGNDANADAMYASWRVNEAHLLYKHVETVEFDAAQVYDRKHAEAAISTSLKQFLFKIAGEHFSETLAFGKKKS